jgi:hypothetical protein
VAGKQAVEGGGGVVGDEGGLGVEGAGEVGWIREGQSVYADDEGLGLCFMYEDVVKGSQAVGAG